MEKSKKKGKMEEFLSLLSDTMKDAEKEFSQEQIDIFNTSFKFFEYIEGVFKMMAPIINQLDKNITPVYEKAEEIKMVLDKVEVINTVWNKVLIFGTLFDGFKQIKDDQSGYI